MTLAQTLADRATGSWAGRAMGYAALTGLVGVLSGFALFSYLWFAADHAHPVRLIIGLLVAACMSFMFEWLREKIRPVSEHHYEHPPLTLGRWLTTVILLLVFELFVVAWHSLPEREGTHFHQLAEAISGLPHAPPLVDLISLIVLWTIVGGALAACLSLCIVEDPRPWYIRCGIGALRGAGYGLVIPPLAVLIAVVCVRFVVALGMMIFQPEAWNAHVDGLLQIAPGIFKLFLFPVVAINYVANFLGPLRPWVLIAALGGFVYLYAKEPEKGFGLNAVALAIIAVFIAPLLGSIEQLLAMLFLAALIWTVPMMLLGAIAPLLAEPSSNRQIWGLSAFAAACMLTGITAARLGWPANDIVPVMWCLVVVLVLGGALVMLLRHVEDGWPVLALTTATLIWTISIVMQQVTFSGVLANFHAINMLPASVQTRQPVAYPISLYPRTDWSTHDWMGLSRWRPPGSMSAALLRELNTPITAPRKFADIDRDIEQVAKSLPGLEAQLDKLASSIAQAKQSPAVAPSITQIQEARQTLEQLAAMHHEIQARFQRTGALDHHPSDDDHASSTAHAAHAPTYQTLFDRLENLCQRLSGKACPDRPAKPIDTPVAPLPLAIAPQSSTEAADKPATDPAAPPTIEQQLAADKALRTQATEQALKMSGELQTQLASARSTLLAAQKELNRPILEVASTLPIEQRISLPSRPAIDPLLPSTPSPLAVEMLRRGLARSSVEGHLATVTKLDIQANARREEVQQVIDQNVRDFTQAEKDLKTATDELARQYWTAFDEYALLAAQRLELALVASFGFWATVGLLIGWSEYYRERDRKDEHPPLPSRA